MSSLNIGRETLLKNYRSSWYGFAFGGHGLGVRVKPLILLRVYEQAESQKRKFLACWICLSKALKKKRYRENRSIENLKPHIITGEIKVKKYKKNFWKKLNQIGQDLAGKTQLRCACHSDNLCNCFQTRITFVR